MLQAVLNGSYRKNGQKVYTYIVTGTQTELANYRAAKGEYNRDTEKGEPLFFLTEFDAQGEKRLIEPKIKLIITQNNRVVVDDTADEQKLMADIKTNLAGEIAKVKAAAWVRRSAAPAPQASTAPTKETKLPSADDLINENQNVNANTNVPEGTESIAD